MVNFRNKRSVACSEATGYRSVIGRLIKFAENELKELYPNLSRKDRIIKAHDEPFWIASKEIRDLTNKERKQVGLSLL